MTMASRGYVLKSEEVPFPPTRAERISAITALLDSGGVHKLVLEAGKPIKALRWVKDPYEGIPEDVLTDTVMSATRNSEIEECFSDDSPAPMALLFRAFSMVTKKGLKPLSLAVKSTTELRKWLKIDPLADTGEVFCTPVLQHNSLPDGVALLISGYAEDKDEVVYSVRVDMQDAGA